MKHLFLLLALALLLPGCTDPIKVEKANAIRRESEAQYMATATAVAIEASEAADRAAIRSGTQDDRIAQQENLIWWSTVAGVVIILALGLAIGISSVGTATAFIYWTKQQAKLIRVDKTTRTWPVMLDTKTGRLVDLETGERGKLWDIKPVDHRRLIISGQARVTGLLAQAAQGIAKSTKDAKPGDMLAAIGQSVPLLKEPEETDGAALALPACDAAALSPPSGRSRRGEREKGMRHGN